MIMHVNFSHREEKHGLIKKTTYYVVDTTITLTEEEKQIIKQRGLDKYVIFSPGIPVNGHADDPAGPQLYDVTFGKLLWGKKISFAHPTPNHAKNYEVEFTEKLRDAKKIITESATLGESKSLEL
jgi:hypothetical protein